MFKIKNPILILILIFFLNFPFAEAPEDEGITQSNTDFTIGNDNMGTVNDANINSAHTYFMENFGIDITFEAGGRYFFNANSDTLIVGDNTIDLNSFKGSFDHKIYASGSKIIVDGNDIKGADNVHLEDGVVKIDSVDEFISDIVTIIGGINVRVFEDWIEAESAESVIVNEGSTASNVQYFSGNFKQFFAEKAEIANRDCLYFYNVSDTEFLLEASQTRLYTSNTTTHIDDCGEFELLYEARENSTLVISQRGEYAITNGNLYYEDSGFSEKLEAYDEASVVVEIYYGFACMDMEPLSAYFYVFQGDKRVDFSIENPVHGGLFRLCVRKDAVHRFADYDGIADLIDDFVKLNGRINYLRYPLKGSLLSGVILERVYQGFASPRTKMLYDKNLVFLKNVTVQTGSANTVISLTTPSNYYQIKEKPANGNVHAFVKINASLMSGELTDNLITNYNRMAITNNILLHKNTRILPPNHTLISSIIN